MVLGTDEVLLSPQMCQLGLNSNLVLVRDISLGKEEHMPVFSSVK